MANKFLGLRTTIYKVPDIERAKAWYTEAFETAPYFDEPFYVGFNIAGYELGLQPDPATAFEKKADTITYWGVENAGQEFDRLISLGATPHEEPTNVGGDIVVASVLDPWGNVIGLIYNPEFTLE